MRIRRFAIMALVAVTMAWAPWASIGHAATGRAIQDNESVGASDQDQDSEKDDESPAARFQAIDAEYTKAMQEFMAAYSKAKPEERPKLFEEKYPQPEPYADRYLQFAEQFPDAPETPVGLAWVVSHIRSGEQPKKALEVLLSRHIDHPKMSEVAMSLSVSFPSARTEQALVTMAETSGNEKVRGTATYALASFLTRNTESAKYVNENPEVAQELEPEVVDYLAKYQFDEDKVKALYQTVIEEFADVPLRNRTLGEIAKAALFEMEHLTVGKIAPDIEGEDLDGEPFKLSDYRGKIVMLDFWGDW